VYLNDTTYDTPDTIQNTMIHDIKCDSTTMIIIAYKLSVGHLIELQVLQGLEAAHACVDDMDEWLRIFNTKLRHMREDIASVHFYALFLLEFSWSCAIHDGSSRYFLVISLLKQTECDVFFFCFLVISSWLF
jgi:hypothetical protein